MTPGNAQIWTAQFTGPRHQLLKKLMSLPPESEKLQEIESGKGCYFWNFTDAFKEFDPALC